MSVALLQVQALEMLAALVADPQIGPHLRPVPGSDTLAVVQEECVERVRFALQELGMPLADGLLSS